jgi:nicotinate-nucleotide adenylyltransferase
MRKTGLFFGSFNPVHTGHMVIANFMATQTDLDEVWMIVSPQNPLKNKKSLARDHDRLHLVRLAIGENIHLRASDVEFSLPQPSYTVDTLVFLREKYPDREFVLIMGGDSLGTLHKWKNYDILLRDYQIYIYQRPQYELGELADHPSIQTWEAPLMQISASYIRRCLREGLSVQYLVPDAVYEYLEGSGLFK